jgi:hypothetical protein
MGQKVNSIRLWLVSLGFSSHHVLCSDTAIHSPHLFFHIRQYIDGGSSSSDTRRDSKMSSRIWLT